MNMLKMLMIHICGVLRMNVRYNFIRERMMFTTLSWMNNRRQKITMVHLGFSLQISYVSLINYVEKLIPVLLQPPILFYNKRTSLDKLFISSFLNLNLCPKLLFGIPYTISTKGGDIMGFYGGYSGGYSGGGYGSSFVLIVVLFILLIIVGATFLY